MHVTTRVLVLAIVVVGAAAGAPGPKGKDARTPADPPAGDWWVEKVEDNGGNFYSKGRVEKLAWDARFTADKWVVSLGGVPLSDERVEYYQNGKVFEMDLSPDDPKKFQKGIWRIDGDRMLVCYGPPGGDRPTDFTAARGSGRMLWTLKRK